MPETTLYIKNMVCNRCIMVVEDILRKNGHTPLHTELGKVCLAEKLTEEELGKIRHLLEDVGFELIDNKRQRLLEQIKQEIIKLIYYPHKELKTNLSDYLADKCHTDYSSLSKLFSEATGTTIEKYVINQKIERGKELLIYDELSLNEISELLHYSSTAHLSSQFKNITGMTPSQFKKQKGQLRKPLDRIL